MTSSLPYSDQVRAGGRPDGIAGIAAAWLSYSRISIVIFHTTKYLNNLEQQWQWGSRRQEEARTESSSGELMRPATALLAPLSFTACKHYVVS